MLFIHGHPQWEADYYGIELIIVLLSLSYNQRFWTKKRQNELQFIPIDGIRKLH